MSFNSLAKLAADTYILSRGGVPSPSFNSAIVQACRLYLGVENGGFNELIVDVCQSYLGVTRDGFNELVVDALTTWLTARGYVAPKDFNSLVWTAANEYVYGTSFEPTATLALDFVYNRYRAPTTGYTNTFTSISGLTVSRSSVGYAETSTGLLVPFASNVARITDRGLLVEEARTNLAVWSGDTSNAGWAGTQVTKTTGQPDPLGGTNAALVTADGTNASHLMNPSSSGPISYTSGTTYTLSRIVKAGTNRYVQLVPNSGAFGSASYANFDLVAGVVGTNTGLIGSGISPLSGGWYRIWISATATTTASAAAGAIAVIGGLTAGRAEINTLTTSYYDFGAQVEVGSFPTSYIPTTSAAATRGADNISISGLSGLTSAATVYGEALAGADAIGTFKRIAELSDGIVNSNGLYVSRSAAFSRAFGFSATVQQFNPTMGAWAAETTGKIAASQAGGTYRAAFAGVAAASVAGAAPVTISQLSIGNSAGAAGGGQPNSYIKRIVIYPRAFSDAELMSATS